jgi:Pumilio-family RNA binding repeat
VLANVDTIARGQWGNWVIQHIVEHGLPEDRKRALEIVLAHSGPYSMDQFASKVIEKALKCCGPEIFHTYIAKIVEKEPGRPRVALVDISSDVYGNYLIQYILQNGPQNVREQISFHVRKHMVSLRGSRYGQRVAFQVERMRAIQPKSASWSGGRWE